MDRVEDIERDRLDDRLGERDRKTERVPEAETDREVSAMLQGYDLGLLDRDDERSPPKLELEFAYLHPHHFPPSHHSSSPPPLVMDISSVRFRPVPALAQAKMTSTYGHPRLN